VGLQLPARTGSARRSRRLSLLALSSLGLVLLTGCSGEGERFAMPEPATEQGEPILALWQGAWIAALATGVVVWGLIFYAAWRFHRRNDDEIPIQTRYNLPLEIFYTIFPVIMVIVFFAHTVDVQNTVLDDDGEPDHTITVVGQQWSWTFNYPHESDQGAWVWEGGTAAIIPTLVIPVGETTEFELVSADVIHDFGVPGFLMKMDVMPGQDNTFRVTPKTIGTYKGKCYELCGVSHSRMLFNVEVVEPADYEEHLDELAEQGFASEDPLIGGVFVREQAGLDSEGESE
jgi:cytochrome c oxidase subunit 2